MEDYRDIIRENILNEAIFIRATFSGHQTGAASRWQKIVIRPVELKNLRHLQFSYFDDKRDITKNYAGEEAIVTLDEVLTLPFRNFTIQTTNGDVQINLSKKGKPKIYRSNADEPRRIKTSHDREKSVMLSPDSATPYLQAVGIMTQDGKIRSDMQSKYRQINEFLRLVQEVGELDKLINLDRPINVVDCGCGNAYLTFAAYYYLTHVLQLPVEMTGIDVNRELLTRHFQKTKALGWEGLSFRATRIGEFVPEANPDIVLALHACDTATDDAIALGIKSESRLIICAPCCHHHLQEQLRFHPSPSPFASVMRHGILHERMGDILTDSLRALLLRIMGYRTDVVQFVSSEHTAKNLMIRAVRTSKPGDPRFIQEYLDLKNFWRVTPYLEELIAEQLGQFTV
ncbi:MAG: methyltransferase [Chloroflexota bacterium]|nr:SAM-dependent methyltransferase [Chloroflexota bacterium]GIK66625.1 MAG: methyltransferase [Chloroflexota bacterium]